MFLKFGMKLGNKIIVQQFLKIHISSCIPSKLNMFDNSVAIAH